MAKFPHCSYGHTYALGASAIPRLPFAADRLPLLHVEDAFITGVVATMANVTRVTAPSFTVHEPTLFNCDIVWGQKVALCDIKQTKHLWRLREACAVLPLTLENSDQAQHHIPRF